MAVVSIRNRKDVAVVEVHNGIFLCDVEDLDIVRAIPWGITNHGSVSYVVCTSHREGKTDLLSFHREVYAKRHGRYVDCIDHRNSVGLDNRSTNLIGLAKGLNSHRRPSVGYSYTDRIPNKRFRVQNNKQGVKKELSFTTEVEALSQRLIWDIERQGLEHLYNPAEDMRFNYDLLMAEVRGECTKEQAYVTRLKQEAKNPWNVLRYGLQGECQKYGIPVAGYYLDEKGFMCNTHGVRLCPTLPEGILRQSRLL